MKFLTRSRLNRIRQALNFIDDARSTNHALVACLKNREGADRLVAIYREKRNDCMQSARMIAAELALDSFAEFPTGMRLLGKGEVARVRARFEGLATVTAGPANPPADAWNTGRLYSPDGQRIAYQVVGTANGILMGRLAVAMVDIDRGIDYVLAVWPPVTRDAVLMAYDNNKQVPGAWVDHQLKQNLTALASTVPSAR